MAKQNTMSWLDDPEWWEWVVRIFSTPWWTNTTKQTYKNPNFTILPPNVLKGITNKIIWEIIEGRNQS